MVAAEHHERVDGSGYPNRLSGDEIYMDYYSRLGPIDPQVNNQEGRQVPALGYLKQWERLQEKAAKVGFDWEKKEDVWKKVIEEVEEMHKSEGEGNYEKLEDEIGDVFFAMVNYARFLGVNPENALRRTNSKFIRRFGYVETKIKESGRKLKDSNLKEMDKYWEESKQRV